MTSCRLGPCAFFLCLLVVSGCSGPSVPDANKVQSENATSASISSGAVETVATTATAAPPPPRADVWSRLPASAKLPGVASVVIADSWSERLSHLSSSEQELLKGINEQYFGALEFSSAEQQTEMMSAGYPMPEEWLAAQKMTDVEIESVAKSGNRKAQMLYADRVSKRGEMLKASGRGEGAGMDMEVLKATTGAAMYSSLALRGSSSPFAAYLYGGVSSRTTGIMESSAAGILLARQLGDRRADQYALNLSKKYPSMNPAVIQVEFTSMSRTAGKR